MSWDKGDVNGIEVYVEPFQSNFFYVSILEIKEEIGGGAPKGHMRLTKITHSSNSTLEKDTEQSTGTIKIVANNVGNRILEIPFLITEKSFFNNILEISFICTKRTSDDFFTKPESQTYNGVLDAISNYFPAYDTDVEPISDLEKISLNQIGEIGKDFCSKLAIGWRPNTVFGYNMEGNLVIRDISKSKLDNKGKLKVALGKTRLFTKFPIISRKPLLDTESYNPWEEGADKIEGNLTKVDYSSVAPKNITSRVYRGTYSIYSRDYASFNEASQYNMRLYDSGFYSKGELKALTFPTYRMGDVVELTYTGGNVTIMDKDSEKVPELSTKTFLIGSFSIFWSGKGAEGARDDKKLGFSVTSTVYGLNSIEWSDKTNKDEQQ